MKKIRLIIQREYLSRVKKKSFIIPIKRSKLMEIRLHSLMMSSILVHVPSKKIRIRFYSMMKHIAMLGLY